MKDFSGRRFVSGAAFPDIPTGLFLKAGEGGEVLGTEVSLPRKQIFIQSIPSAIWQFSHNFGIIPEAIVRTYDSATGLMTDITASVNIEVDDTIVKISTDNNVLLTGEIEVSIIGFGDNNQDAISLHAGAVNPHSQYLLTADLEQAIAQIGINTSPGSTSSQVYELVTVTTKTIALNVGYIVDTTNEVAFEFSSSYSPSAKVGDIVEIIGNNQGGWRLNLVDGHTVHFNQSSTTGNGGSLVSVESSACVLLKCIKAEPGSCSWRVTSAMGNFDIV